MSKELNVTYLILLRKSAHFKQCIVEIMPYCSSCTAFLTIDYLYDSYVFCYLFNVAVVVESFIFCLLIILVYSSLFTIIFRSDLVDWNSGVSVRPYVRPYVHKKFFRFPSNLVCG